MKLILEEFVYMEASYDWTSPLSTERRSFVDGHRIHQRIVTEELGYDHWDIANYRLPKMIGR